MIEPTLLMPATQKYINLLTYHIGYMIEETETVIKIRWETGTLSEITKSDPFYQQIRKING